MTDTGAERNQGCSKYSENERSQPVAPVAPARISLVFHVLPNVIRNSHFPPTLILAHPTAQKSVLNRREA
jgi:hypothetical protein